nr:efflux RND transporter permease subunit [Sulfitobacter albidus]
MFVDRPILATVLSFVVLIVGTVSYFSLPVSEYPEIAPPPSASRPAIPVPLPRQWRRRSRPPSSRRSTASRA